LIKNKKIVGVHCTKSENILAKKVIVTSGTYMSAITHIGNEQKKEGPQSLKRSDDLSRHLKDIGFQLLRLKTGTPPRVAKNTVDFKSMLKEPGTNQQLSFQHFDQRYIPIAKQELCYLAYTNQKTHNIIRNNIHLSAMYSGNIKGVGPRYCPSIEDKIVRFSDKPRHQVFVEPESKSIDTMYLQGLSTSLPRNVQDKLVHSIKGLEKAEIVNYGYAIEYDAINPIQLWPSLESKQYANLYFAGQVNGTSGYEEAACQGLMAGINAYLSIKKKKPLILKRDEAYIGVLIDDLVTKGVNDPYRLLTSRAEYRLLLRNDNADDRLLKYGYQIGLINKSKYEFYTNQQKLIKSLIAYLRKTSLKSNKTLIKKYGNSSHNLYSLLKRPEVKLVDIVNKIKLSQLTDGSINKVEINVKFDGYIKNQQKFINRFDKFDDISLSSIKDYSKLNNLSLEARDKLNRVKPLTLGQAKRISGISLTDLIVIKYFLDKR
jgi:tRNA uridine 5-carboxymethylaminomethyl modification enzyme